ncbi:hypothetical protein DWUX_1757 [Desulfovibrio diazotrophicus]|nr:hypothetical protein DWUX_1757 [Desulfovibrio diazotrophicus]VVU42925.1 hypothetical protein DWUX_271 [Desulfovibrio diazotrophicus]
MHGPWRTRLSEGQGQGGICRGAAPARAGCRVAQDLEASAPAARPACSKTGAVLRQFLRDVLQLKDFSEKREKLLAKPLGLT